MSKKVFRHTPHRAADAMKIIVGNKTNATIRDVEETLEDIEEKEGRWYFLSECCLDIHL